MEKPNSDTAHGVNVTSNIPHLLVKTAPAAIVMHIGAQIRPRARCQTSAAPMRSGSASASLTPLLPLPYMDEASPLPLPLPSSAAALFAAAARGDGVARRGNTASCSSSSASGSGPTTKNGRLKPPATYKKPPTGGPIAQPAPSHALAAPITAPLFCGNASVRMAKMHVVASAAPPPCTTRSAIIAVTMPAGSPAKIPAAMPMAIVESETQHTPTVSTRLRPNPLANPPANGAMASCATAKAPKTAATCVPSMPTSCAYSGKNGATMAKVELIVHVCTKVAPRKISWRSPKPIVRLTATADDSYGC